MVETNSVHSETDMSKVSAEYLWTKYVRRRLPLKMSGMLQDKEWRASRWTDEYLHQQAGDSNVRVEVRDDSVDEHGRGRFGKGLETTMTFGEFLNKLGEEGNNLHYLTTQDLEYDEEGQPAILSEPVKQLVGDFPWRPKIMGNLVLQNANIWFGKSSKAPTSSGLHHDFHDNLYILLRGRKHFTLYPPQCHEAMYTNEEISKVHANGRINYVGHPPTNADGSDQAAVAASMATKRLEEADDEGDEEGVEAALEALLDAERSSEDEDDYDEEEGDDEAKVDSSDSEVDEDTMAAMKRKLAPALGGLSSGSDRATTKKRRTGTSTGITTGTDTSCRSSTSNRPANFSRVDTSMPLSSLRKEFPLFCSKQTQDQRREVWLEAGQMLYLPAGWFHEVTSDDGEDGGIERGGGGGGKGHLAFNYWFHPPDQLHEGADHRQPYSSSFWAEDWARRSHSLSDPPPRKEQRSV